MRTFRSGWQTQQKFAAQRASLRPDPPAVAVPVPALETPVVPTTAKLDAALQRLEIPQAFRNIGRAHNPSVTVHRGELRVVVRVVDQDRNTSNVFGVIQDGVMMRPHVSSDLATHERHPTPLRQGYEDCRPFEWNERLWAVATTYDTMAGGGAGRIVVLELSDVGDVINVHPQAGRRVEKNWMPVDQDGRLRFVYSVDAGIVVDFNAVSVPDVSVPQFRGGSQLVCFGDHWLAVVHEVQGEQPRVYQHRFVLFDRNLRVVQRSKPFHFQHVGVEFCAGLAAWRGGFVASFGVNDCEAWLATVTDESVCRMLGVVRQGMTIVVPKNWVLVCHSPHERCGIGEYGRQLDVSLSKMAAVFSFKLTDQEIAAQGVTSNETVLVHYEPMLIPEGFVEKLRHLRARGAKVVFCCHWYARDTLSAYSGLVDAFVVHRSCSEPSAPRTVEIPLGCPTYQPSESREALRERLGFQSNDTVITTVGFLVRWKQIPQTLDALLSQTSNHRIVFQVQTPWHFSNQESKGEDESVRAILARYPNARVKFSTEFLPEKELLDRVHASDLGFVFHGQNTNSVSAATKQFVSARTPLVITESSHGTDLRGGVVRVPGFDAAIFAREVLRVAEDPARLDGLRRAMMDEYARINMDAVAGKYLELFRSLR
jgi:hypothetical protein